MELHLDAPISTGNILEHATVYEVVLPANLIPLWQKAGIYDILYIEKFPRCTGKVALPDLVYALTDMCIYRSDYRKLVGQGVYRQGLVFLSTFIRECELYPNSGICIH